MDNVSQVVREVCDKLNNEYGLEVYPEMLDFTWENSLRNKFLDSNKGNKIDIRYEASDKK